jgi:PAS domain S-box-containing protein
MQKKLHLTSIIFYTIFFRHWGIDDRDHFFPIFSPIAVGGAVSSLEQKPSYEELEQKIQKLEQAEKDREVIRDRLSKVMKIARIGYWEHDIVKGLFTFNDDFYRIFRTTAEKVGGYTVPSTGFLLRFVHPDDISYLQSEMKKTVEMGTARAGFQIETRIIRDDGTTGHLAIRYLNVKVKDGNTIISIGVIQDITERKEAEEQLRAITDSARDAILMMDSQGDIQYWNPAAQEILGYTAGEAMGKNLHRLLAPRRFHPAHFKAFQEFIISGTGDAVGSTLELSAIRKDGREIPVDLSLSGVSLNGRWHAVGVLRDVTDRKKTEAALREGEKRFRDLSEMLPEVVFETDMDLKLTFVNRQAYTVFGRLKEDLEKGVSVFDVVAPQDVDRARKNAEKRFRGELFSRQEYLGRKKDGTTFPMLLHASPIMSGEKPVGLRGVLIDITEQKRIEEQLLQGQKMKSIGTLAGGIAHDFNNILQPMLGYCEFLKEELPAGSAQYGYVEGIFKASLRARELVRQILTFSRQSDQRKLPIKVQKVLKEAVRLARSTIPSNIEIHQDVLEDPVYIEADSTQLHQIVMNLIINAYHAVAKSGGRISVLLTRGQMDKTELEGLSLKPGNYARLSVSDTGVGIDPAIMDKIFEPYFTTRSRSEGTGLGLAVVYGIVKAHGGDIRVRSEVGKGADIQIYLPLTDKPTEIAEPEAEETHPAGSERILFVDDEEMVVKIGSMMLERLGYEVVPFTDSTEALAAFRADPAAYDLVISDMAMPGMTGDQLAGKCLEIKPGLPIIICTGYSERIGCDEAEAIGVREFLRKPISLKNLSRKVRNVLDTSSPQA